MRTIELFGRLHCAPRCAQLSQVRLRARSPPFVRASHLARRSKPPERPLRTTAPSRRRRRSLAGSGSQLLASFVYIVNGVFKASPVCSEPSCCRCRRSRCCLCDRQLAAESETTAATALGWQAPLYKQEHLARRASGARVAGSSIRPLALWAPSLLGELARASLLPIKTTRAEAVRQSKGLSARLLGGGA